MTDQKETADCGTKRIRLAAMIISVVLTICTATVAYSMSAVATIDARVRLVEQSNAANAARFEAIQQTLERMERRKR